MGKTWTDRGNGQWKLSVSADIPGDSRPPSVFYGTKEEIADKLADAQENANRRIDQLKRNGAAPPAAGLSSPRTLSPAERMQTVAELNDPATVDKAVTRVMESAIGPLESLREDRQQERAERETRDAVEAAKKFSEQTPDWYPSDHNKNVLVGYMRRMGLSSASLEDYTQAFEELSTAKLLQAKPSEDDDNDEQSDERQERNAPTPAANPKAPTRFATGIRSSDISGTPPMRTTARMKFTREQIDRMSAATYKQTMLSDPELARSVEFYKQQDRQRTRTRAS